MRPEGRRGAKRKMRARHYLYLLGALAVTAALSTVGSAVGEVPVQSLEAQTVNSDLPSSSRTGVTLRVKPSTADDTDEGGGTLPEQTSNFKLDVDSDIVIKPDGLPGCDADLLAGKDLDGAMAACGKVDRKSWVGYGNAHIQVGSGTVAGTCPPTCHATVLAFRGTKRNDCLVGDTPYAGGTKGIVLWARANALATTVVLCGEIKPSPLGGEYGTRLEVPVDLIAGGAGAISDFEVFVGRRQNGKDYVKAKCSDGVLDFKSTATYYDGHSPEVDDVAQACT